MRGIRAARRSGVIPALLLGAAVSLAVIGLSRVGVFSGWETRAVDPFQFMRDQQAPAGIVLVHIASGWAARAGGTPCMSWAREGRSSSAST